MTTPNARQNERRDNITTYNLLTTSLNLVKGNYNNCWPLIESLVLFACPNSSYSVSHSFRSRQVANSMLFPEDESSLGDLVLIGQSTLSPHERQPPSVVVAVLEYADHDTVILGGATNPHGETADEDYHSSSSCGDEGFSYMEQLLFDFNNLACFNSHRSRKDTSGNNNHNHNHNNNNSNSSSSSSCLLMDYDFVSSTNMMIPKEDKVYRRKYADI